ncbi:MAG TPA: phosphatase PAP2 family protein, partial [Blastocatellia bacterium]|nr:phosphatase PAP2 family protein [Blastocatellia bacterium]
PLEIAPSSIDRLIPFVDWTVWVYHSQFFFLAFCVWAMRKPENISRALYAMGLASLLSFCVFLAFPTTLPRRLPPVEGLTAQAFALLYWMDSDANCFPSLHVALGWIAALGVMRERRSLGAFAVVIAVLISASTLTTKQHYFVDVLAGLGVAVLCRLLVGKMTFRRSGAREFLNGSKARQNL